MKILILCGGISERLWPLTSAALPKQFLPVLRHGRGRESMIQHLVRQLRQALPEAGLYAVAQEEYKNLLEEQVGEEVRLIREPCRRNTFAAVCLGVLRLQDAGTEPDEPVLVLPSDLYAGEGFFRKLREMEDLVRVHPFAMALLGLAGKKASAQVGYLTLDEEGRVPFFTEKPPLEEARRLTAEGALQNAGVFAFTSEAFLFWMRERGLPEQAEALEDLYPSLPPVSLDRHLLCTSGAGQGRGPSIPMCGVAYQGQWEDLGTWETLGAYLESSGEYREEGCSRNTVINRLGIPVFLRGLSHLLVCITPEGILITGKDDAGKI